MARTRWLLTLSLAAASCALFPQQRTENLLASAGFRIVAANTPEKIQALNTLPAKKISRVDRNGSIYYVYADTGECRCLRVGREEQYQRYRRLASGAKEDTLDINGNNTQSDTFKGYDPW